MHPASTLAAASVAGMDLEIPLGTTWIGSPAQQFGMMRTTAVKNRRKSLLNSSMNAMNQSMNASFMSGGGGGAKPENSRISVMSTSFSQGHASQLLSNKKFTHSSSYLASVSYSQSMFDSMSGIEEAAGNSFSERYLPNLVHLSGIVGVLGILSAVVLPCAYLIYYSMQKLDYVYVIPIFVGVHNLFGFSFLLITVFFKRVFFSFGGTEQHGRGSLGYVRWLVFSTLLRLADIFFLRHIAGTRFTNWWYRAMGSKIGRDAYISCPAVVESDMLRIGDYSTIGENVALVLHSFDNGCLEFKPLFIGKNVVIGAQCVLLTDVSVGNNTVLQPGSFALPAQAFDADSVWRGNLARCVYQGEDDDVDYQPPVNLTNSLQSERKSNMNMIL